MNKPILTIIMAVALAVAIAAPVIGSNRKAKAAAAAKCSMFAKYDSKTKSCVKR